MTGELGLLLLPLLVGLGAPSSVLPENLRVEGINTKYLLKWDWDYQQNPYVTFSVKKSFLSQSNWSAMEDCVNITSLECDVSSIDTVFRYKFLVSAYNHLTDERNFNTVTFVPQVETVIGPPTNVKLSIFENNLHITVGAPEGLKNDVLHQSCTWMYHLEIWKNSTPSDVITMEDGPNFIIKDVEASATYCARARIQCNKGNRTGLYSEIYCHPAATRSYIKELIIGSVFGGIIVISLILYICLCPLKRYMKHVFFPKSKLPSSIEKGVQDSPQNCIKNFFLLNEEEPTDTCYIMQDSPEDAEVTIDKNSSGSKGRDSGNYSNEDEVHEGSTVTRQ